MKTYQPKKNDVTREWHLIDVKGKVLGRVASEISIKLIGKHKVNYSRHMDSGDYVVAINAGEIKVTGKKEDQKVYRSHSGYPAGFKEVKYSKLLSENPNRILELAVKGMIPDNRLKDKRLSRLKIFTGDKHPYEDKVKK
ncbi:MAG: 50S ribosomal protein L13 [Candidatus Woesebacteria bacterium GW2011_GWB1_38_5]|uniref:Large ribosomal subunit protein uL13 n=4 Tax=Candidatus Woeseibacteriota TaxID=1752722 RepID=A0A0G0P414_9BACT|nr:MAG: 50S ribosomal protein L13 [Candidatus Woesebacteria bacterium GW2011_GWD1_38_10]KKQ56351.1 MAG: 50S ribosomal protein L13 [Candidatus Woesebacteria bacterium GW2011_GWC1_38_13]KKQ75069.1 MAG: 50S ribosomal protein L13 [Candidatus Woesebacteria bacterium GW2011_GWB1_38_5]KKQ84046.1 MAG: 50S ribosomal protein L13 [Candidatus Woesebacteria bacterium GW2011_GWA1_38_8]